MSDIIFKKNKLKFLFITFLLSVIIFITGYVSILFILNPSDYIYWLMPTKLIVLTDLITLSPFNAISTAPPPPGVDGRDMVLIIF